MGAHGMSDMKYMHVYVCAYMRETMYVYVYVRIYVRMYVGIYVYTGMSVCTVYVFVCASK